MSHWTETEIDRSVNDNDIFIAPDHDDKRTPGRLIWVCAVSVNEDEYVRNRMTSKRSAASVLGAMTPARSAASAEPRRYVNSTWPHPVTVGPTQTDRANLQLAPSGPDRPRPSRPRVKMACSTVRRRSGWSSWSPRTSQGSAGRRHQVTNAVLHQPDHVET